MKQPLVTMLLPTFRTPKLTKLCLRLLKKYTDLNKLRIIAIDSGFDDDTVNYLKSLSWVDFVPFKPHPDDSASMAHNYALDTGLAMVDTPYVLSFHTDTLVFNKKWLDVLLKEIEDKPNVGGVGSWKLESKPWINQRLKKIEFFIQTIYTKLLGKPKPNDTRPTGDYYFLRSHCALYRTALFHKLNVKFSTGKQNAGKVVHEVFSQAGYDMIFLPSDYLSRYMDHLNHATMVLNSEYFSKKPAQKKALKRIKQKLNALNADAIIANDSLDQ